MSNTFLSIGHMVFPLGLAMFLFVVNAKYGTQACQCDMKRGVVTPMAGAVFGTRETFGLIVLMALVIAGVTGCGPPLIWMTPAGTIQKTRSVSLREIPTNKNNTMRFSVQ